MENDFKSYQQFSIEELFAIANDPEEHIEIKSHLIGIMMMHVFWDLKPKASGDTATDSTSIMKAYIDNGMYDVVKNVYEKLGGAGFAVGGDPLDGTEAGGDVSNVSNGGGVRVRSFDDAILLSNEQTNGMHWLFMELIPVRSWINWKANVDDAKDPFVAGLVHLMLTNGWLELAVNVLQAFARLKGRATETSSVVGSASCVLQMCITGRSMRSPWQPRLCSRAPRWVERGTKRCDPSATPLDAVVC